MKVLVTGSGGLVGQHLVQQLESDGHEVIRLVRDLQDAESTVILWDPSSPSMMNKARLEGLDAVIHLAGDNIASERWTPEKKMRIRNSRVQGTGLLASTLATLDQKPDTFLCASAIGFYGDRDDEICTEETSNGDGFLANVCRDWEQATQPAVDAGIRTLQLRFGMALSSQGGALDKIIPPFKLGLGGVIGSGQQYWSWISLRDAVMAITHLLHTTLSGPINIVSPNAATNREFTKALGSVLHRPTVLPMPGFMAQTLIGEMADDLMLCSTRVAPTQLTASGFSFQDPELSPLLTRLIKGAA